MVRQVPCQVDAEGWPLQLKPVCAAEAYGMSDHVLQRDGSWVECSGGVVCDG